MRNFTVSTVAIPVTEFPLPNPIVNFNGTLFYTGTYYVTYQWYENLAAIAGATSSSTPSTGTGDYKVQVTDTNGCQSFSDAYIYTGGSTTGVNNIHEGGIDIFPNPVADELMIEITDVSVLGGVKGFTMTNNLGQEVMEQPLTLMQTKVNVSALPAGMYYITIAGERGSLVRKFVKM